MKKLICLALLCLVTSSMAFADSHVSATFTNVSSGDSYNIKEASMAGEGGADLFIPAGEESSLAVCVDDHHCAIYPGGVINIVYNANKTGFYSGQFTITSTNPGSSAYVDTDWGGWRYPDLDQPNIADFLWHRLSVNFNGHGNIRAFNDNN